MRRAPFPGGLVAAISLAVLSSAQLAADCDPEGAGEVALFRTTGPPPTRTANIREVDEGASVPQIELSRGVVLGARCWDSCDFVCEAPQISVANASVLGAFPLERFDRIDPDVALVAVGPGQTNLTIATACASKTYLVTVLDD